MKRMLEKELARYKAGMNAAQAMWSALMEAETDEVLATNFMGSAKLAAIKSLRRDITEANDRLAGAHAALVELDSKVPETDANRERMQLSALRYYFLLKKLEAKAA